MGTTAEKGQRVLQSIEEIQQGINNLGGNLTDQTPFKDFRTEIDNIYNKFPKTSFSEGSNITLENCTKGKIDFDDGKVGYGDTEQETTEGYNLLPYVNTTRTINGITFTNNGDGTITANGTATDNAIYPINIDGTTATRNISLGAGTYVAVDGVGDYTNYFTQITNTSIYLNTGATGATGVSPTGTSTETTNFSAVIYIRSGKTVNNVVFKPMLVKSTDVNKPFEKYSGGYASPSPNWEQKVKYVRGRNRLDENTLSQGGWNGASTKRCFFYSNEYLEAGTYTLITNLDTSIFRYSINIGTHRFPQSSGQTIDVYDSGWQTSSYKTFTITQDGYLGVGAKEANDGDIVPSDISSYKFMVYKGEYNSVLSYIPYNTIPIMVKGINEFKPTLTYNGTTIRATNCSVTLNNDEFTFSATGADMRFGDVISAGTAFASSYGYLMQIPDNATNVYLLVTNNQFDKCFVCFYDKNKISLGFSSITTSKEIPSGAKYIDVRVGKSNSVSGTTYKTKVMVAFSSITTYEPYVTPITKQLSLGNYKPSKIGNYVDYFYRTYGKNLAKNVIVVNTTTAYAGSLYIDTLDNLLPNTEYTLSFIGKNGVKVYINENITGVQYITCNGSKQSITFKTVSNISKTNSSQYSTSVGGWVIFKNQSGNTEEPTFTQVQLELSDTATDYNPYGSGEWYYHPITDEVILKGTETYTYDSTYTRFYTQLSFSYDTSVRTQFLCNRYINGDSTTSGHFGTNAGGKLLYFYTPNSSITTTDGFKTWLSNNNLKILLKKAEGTDTEITDATMLSQLEEIYNIMSINGTTKLVIDGDLPLVMKVRALKGN